MAGLADPKSAVGKRNAHASERLCRPPPGVELASSELTGGAVWLAIGAASMVSLPLEGAKPLAVVTGCEPEVSLKELAESFGIFIAAPPRDLLHTLMTKL